MIAFVCARCGHPCPSFSYFAEHIYLCCGALPEVPVATHTADEVIEPVPEPFAITAEDLKDMAYFKAESDERTANEMQPVPARTRKQRAPKAPKPPALPIGEIDLAPTETAPDGEGNAQSAGVRPSTPFARAVDRNRAGDGWKRRTPARPTRYCRCGMALPSRPVDRCPDCGRAVAQ